MGSSLRLHGSSVLTSLLWHYADGTALKSIIQNRVLWASSPAFMNDLNELLSGSRMLQDLLRNEKEELGADEKARLEELIRGDGLRSDRFILSACADGDSLTMWRSYGRAAVSYAIAVDRSVPLQPRAQSNATGHPNPTPTYYSEWEDEAPDGTPIMTFDPDQTYVEGEKWQDVIYEKDTQASMVKHVFESLKRSVKKELSSKAKGESKIFMHNWFATEPLYQIKDHGFRDERESRILMTVHPSWKFVLYRPERFGLVPYVEIGCPSEDEFDNHGR